MIVHGKGLGHVAFKAMGHRGQAGCKGIEWELKMSVRCMTGHKARGSWGERGGAFQRCSLQMLPQLRAPGRPSWAEDDHNTVGNSCCLCVAMLLIPW